jgi:DNA-binding MarR family transcriptional regulator
MATTKGRPQRAARGDMEGAAADEAFEIADRLHSVAIHLLRRLRRADAATGIPGPRLSALSVLVFGGPLTVTELATAEQVRPPTMTRIIAALEAAELVEREGDPKDRRLVRVHATRRGIEVLEEGRRRRIGLLARELEALPPADRELLGRSLDTLEQVVGGRHWPSRRSNARAPGGGN